MTAQFHSKATAHISERGCKPFKIYLTARERCFFFALSKKKAKNNNNNNNKNYLSAFLYRAQILLSLLFLSIFKSVHDITSHWTPTLGSSQAWVASKLKFFWLFLQAREDLYLLLPKQESFSATGRMRPYLLRLFEPLLYLQVLLPQSSPLTH